MKAKIKLKISEILLIVCLNIIGFVDFCINNGKIWLLIVLSIVAIVIIIAACIAIMELFDFIKKKIFPFSR